MKRPPPNFPQRLRILFALTSMPVGGAETLLLNLVRGLNRAHFAPQIACLKQLGELGEVIAREVPTTWGYLSHRWDVRVLPRLIRYLRREQIDVLVTVGAGDKMFWGRLAAGWAQRPVVISALHSTGWPDGVGRLNRCLTPWTDAFVGVAEEHGRHLIEQEGFPVEKVHVIPNGVDTNRFRRDLLAGSAIREELQIPLDAPLCGIVAALRPEKQHRLFLEAADCIRQRFPDSHFLVVGDGPERDDLEAYARLLGLSDCVHFLGTRSDVPAILSALNVLLLTSKMEANPVSILEALAAEVPVVARNVGSVAETVLDGQTGYLVTTECPLECAAHVTHLLQDPAKAQQFGARGRQLVCDHWSLEMMIRGYERLITDLVAAKLGQADLVAPASSQSPASSVREPVEV